MKRMYPMPTPPELIDDRDMPSVSLVGLKPTGKNHRQHHLPPKLAKTAKVVGKVAAIIMAVWFAAGLAKAVIYPKAPQNWVDVPIHTVGNIVCDLITED
ncbi:MAG: hypothetical protein KGJ35_02365 [Patescibacteria group bacterium]|nr:hypothetical protein [Patescibacteria group bacterium]